MPKVDKIGFLLCNVLTIPYKNQQTFGGCKGKEYNEAVYRVVTTGSQVSGQVQLLVLSS